MRMWPFNQIISGRLQYSFLSKLHGRSNLVIHQHNIRALAYEISFGFNIEGIPIQ